MQFSVLEYLHSKLDIVSLREELFFSVLINFTLVSLTAQTKLLWKVILSVVTNKKTRSVCHGLLACEAIVRCALISLCKKVFIYDLQ